MRARGDNSAVAHTEMGYLLKKVRDSVGVRDKTDPIWFIQHLLRNPDSLEFVYLSPVNKGTPEFNPYKAKIVPHESLDESDYYTLSSAGVTHFVDGIAEFVPLKQWLREYHLYTKIQGLFICNSVCIVMLFTHFVC